MPDTPIDLSEGIQSVRLKVPTAEVPIPPEGFAQLHSPAPGELALRLPDGSVAPVGGGGGGGGAATSVLGPGGAIDAANSDPRIGININAVPGTGIGFTGRFLDQFAKPLGVQVDTVLVSSAEILTLDTTPVVVVPSPGAGRWLLPALVWVRMLPGATPYTLAPAPALSLSVSGHVGAFAWASNSVGSLLDAVDETVVTMPPGGNFVPMSWLEDAAWVVALDGPVTGGDGVLEVGVLYTAQLAG